MCSVHDTVEFEKRGIPATLVMTEIFRNSAIHAFRAKGMDAHPYVVLPHPISNLTPERVSEVTLAHIKELVSQISG